MTQNILESWGAIHSNKIPTGPTGKSGPPHKADPFFRNFSGWTERFGPKFPEIRAHGVLSGEPCVMKRLSPPISWNVLYIWRLKLSTARQNGGQIVVRQVLITSFFYKIISDSHPRRWSEMRPRTRSYAESLKSSRKVHFFQRWELICRWHKFLTYVWKQCWNVCLKTLCSYLKSFIYPINVNLEQFVWNPQLRSSVLEI